MFAPTNAAFEALLNETNGDTRIIDNKHPLTGGSTTHASRAQATCIFDVTSVTST